MSAYEKTVNPTRGTVKDDDILVATPKFSATGVASTNLLPHIALTRIDFRWMTNPISGPFAHNRISGSTVLTSLHIICLYVNRYAGPDHHLQGTDAMCYFMDCTFYNSTLPVNRDYSKPGKWFHLLHRH